MIFPPRTRKVVLSVHIAVSVGWIGAIGGYLALDVTTFASDDAVLLRAAYLGMGLIAGWVILPLALAALVTGVLVSVGTKWGLVRHWWTVISLLLTVFATLVLLSELRTISAFAAIASDAATMPDQLRGLGSTLPHSVGGTLVLLVVLVLNVIKPRGLTPYGWRKLIHPRSSLHPNSG